MQAAQPRPKKPKCQGYRRGKRCTRLARYGDFCHDHHVAPAPAAAPITPRCEAKIDSLGTTCLNSQVHGRYCELHFVTHHDPPAGFHLNAIGLIYALAHGETVEVPATLTGLDEIATRFRRYHNYARSTDRYHVFFPDTAQAQDDLTFLLVALTEALSADQMAMYRVFDSRNQDIACFSVLLDALRLQEYDECSLVLPSTDVFIPIIHAYDMALLQSVQDGQVFPARACVDLVGIFSLATDAKVKIRLTLLDRVVQETTDEQLDRWLHALSVCLPRYRQELRVTLDEVLGLYGDLTHQYFQDVDGPRRTDIEYALDDRRHRSYVAQLALCGDVRETTPERPPCSDPKKALRDLDAAASRLRHIPERLIALALQTNPLPHTPAILVLPNSDEAKEAVERCKKRWAEMTGTP